MNKEKKKIKIPKIEKCENCIHFWKKGTDKAICTHPNIKNKVKKIDLFIVCDYFNGADMEDYNI